MPRMSMGTRETDQPPLWIAASDLPASPGHPFYARLNAVLDAQGVMRRRGELIERSFAHVYDTGAMRRIHLRGHSNILKRLLIHAGGFNLGLVMRQVIGLGTPRGLQDRPAVVLATVLAFLSIATRRVAAICRRIASSPPCAAE